jgi:hypothetical protein
MSVLGVNHGLQPSAYRVCVSIQRYHPGSRLGEDHCQERVESVMSLACHGGGVEVTCHPSALAPAPSANWSGLLFGQECCFSRLQEASAGVARLRPRVLFAYALSPRRPGPLSLFINRGKHWWKPTPSIRRGLPKLGSGSLSQPSPGASSGKPWPSALR